ncbi:hypothetical protein Rhe02_70520 [Rhizocola hellebori]|uniref:Chaplin domain-containing protein n=1 Tax=Rhizocola hellebori TaxID=1392758 RepID=A0A8J3QDW3_9ACTN|nr:chaplin family protein [Rhizocola hellebori]GIH08985.1 hypothetical protein Rhe02_70520 [Rhizocola hellebori]
MNTWVRRSLKAGALTAGAVMATGTAAYADTTLISADNTGILNGTQVFAPIQAPINLCGVSAAVLGTASARCEGGSAADLQGLYDIKMISAGNTGILNGTQVFAPIQAPINLCGVAASVLGSADAGCQGGSSATLGSAHHQKGKNCKNGCKDGHHYTESGKADILGGLPVVGGLTQNLPLVDSLPLVGGLTKGGLGNVGGLGGGLPLVGPLLSGILGGVGGGSANTVNINDLDSVGTMPRLESEGGPSTGGHGGGTPGCGTTCPPAVPPAPPAPPAPPVDEDKCPPEHGHKPKHGKPGKHGEDVKMVSAGNVGIGNGTQIYAPIQIPIDVSGLAVGILGQASAWSLGGSSAIG